MRNYWLKILFSALGIFAVGMVVVTGLRSLKSKVTTTLNSSDPIPIPLIGLVPFRLDSEKLGGVSRVEFLRSDPEHVAGVRVVVKLADSVAIDRLRSCEITLDDADKINEHTTFRCIAPGAQVGGHEPFGVIAVSGRSDTFPLLLPSQAVKELRQTTIHLDHSGLHVTSHQDAAADAAAARMDSIRESLSDRIDARNDSVEGLKDLAATLEDSATGLGAAPRRRVQHSADSVRALMRAMVDRMKTDEARLKAMEGSPGLSPEQIDSLSNLGSMITDSVRRALAGEVRAAQAEARRGAVEAQVEVAPAAPAPPPSPKPR
jgi:hypothetical protein